MKNSTRSFRAPVEKLTDHFEKQFNASILETQRNIGHTQQVSLKEVASCVNKLKNNKIPGPGSVRNENLKQLDPSVIQKTLNGYNKNKSNVLTEGYLEPICKPSRDPTASESYRPVMLLSSYRKLLSLIILESISLILENSLSASQFA